MAKTNRKEGEYSADYWVQYVEDKFKEAKNYRSTRVEKQWMINYAFYKGWQNLKYNTHTQRLVFDESDPLKFYVNMVYTTVRAIRAAVTKDQPIWDVDARPYGSMTQGETRALSAYLDTLYEKLDVKYKTKELVMYGLLYGAGIFQYGFDADADEGEGEVWVETLDPFDVYIDPVATGMDDARHIIKVVRKSVEDLQKNPRYQNTDGLGADNKLSESPYKEMIARRENNAYGEAPNTILLYEAWCKTDDGIRVITTAGGRLLRNEVTSFKNLPFLVYQPDINPNEVYGEVIWLPQETVDAIDEYIVAIKGPLTTPVGGGIRSINVALRQRLDLYACVRPVQYFSGVPSPVKHPELVNMVIFRENTEDIYAGIEWEAYSEGAEKIIEFMQTDLGVQKIRFPDSSGIGIKPVSEEGTSRLVRAAIQYALDNDRKSVTLVHKGNIMKFTEGAFRSWGYKVAAEEFGGQPLDGGPWQVLPGGLIVKDVIADAMLQQILTRPAEYDIIATLNLNGDYISDALAAQVGGIGIAPGANINYVTGRAIFEATHGTAPKYAGQDKVNPSSVILSGEMMLRHMGWTEAAELIVSATEKTLSQKVVTYDFARLMEGATKVKCSEFGQALIGNM